MSSLRRSARARVPATDSDGVVIPEPRKRKRSTMTPETSQSPAKGNSPGMEDSLHNGSAEHSSPLAANTSSTRPLARKIIVKTSRKLQSDPSTTSSQISAPTSNGITNLDSEGDAKQDNLQDTLLSEDDKKKLETIIKAYAPDLLAQKVTSSSQEKANSIQQILSRPECSVRALRNHLMALRLPLISPSSLRPHLSSSYIAPPLEDAEADRRKLSNITMLLAVTDEIGIRNRSAVKLETDESEDNKSQSRGLLSEDDYALHMRLPSGDYFTNAIRLSSKEALHLDPGNSKLISVATQPVTIDTRPPPTLKDRLPIYKPTVAITDTANDADDTIRPVSHLYYNAWSSFAPTYDSFDGNVGIRASCALWRAKRDDRKILEHLAEEPVSCREDLEDLLENMKDVDADAILDTYDGLKEDANLDRSGTLLYRLDELHSQRWKRAFARRILNEDDLPDEPSEEEREIASEIVDILSEILDSNSGSLSEVVPSVEALRAAASSAVIDPALIDGKGETGYWGSLNESLYGPTATRRVTGARSIPIRPMPALRDNETIKMEPVNEEKVMAQAGIASKGKGLLERFAFGRQYKLEDHPHDRKLIAPTTNAQASPLPGATTPQHQLQQHQGRPPANSYPPQSGHHMSPPMSTPPSRPYHQSPMRPSPSPSYPAQKQGGGYFYNSSQQQHSSAQQHQSNQRAYSQHQSQQPYYPARPYTDHRYVSGSPS